MTTHIRRVGECKQKSGLRIKVREEVLGDGGGCARMGRYWTMKIRVEGPKMKWRKKGNGGKDKK